jgi:hypothetical protein
MIKQSFIKSVLFGFVLAIYASAAFCQNGKRCKAEADTAFLYFNQKGEWIEGFPDKIAKEDGIVQWKLPDTIIDQRVFKKFKEAAATVDSLKTVEQVKVFMRKHPLLLYVFFNNSDQDGLTVSKDDTTIIANNFIAYKDSLKKYFDSLSSLKDYSKAKQSTNVNNPYFPCAVTDYTASFSVTAKNQYGRAIDNHRLKNGCLKWETDNSITFSIYRELRDNQVIAAHYKTTHEKYQQVGWLFERQKLLNLENTALLNEVEKLVTQWEQERKLGETEKATETLNRLIEKNDAVQLYINKTSNFQKLLVKENREWIKCWLWFTNWEPIMNPLELFGFAKEERMKELKKNIDSSKENISYLTKFIENKNIEKFSNFDELKKATEQLAGMTVTVKQLETEYGKLEKEKKDLAEKRDALKIEKQLVHVGELFGSDNKKWQPLRFHNYSKNLEFVNKTQNNQYFWDGDDEKLIAANVPAGVNVSLTEKIEAYVPKSFFSTLIDPVLDGFFGAYDTDIKALQQQALELSQLKNPLTPQNEEFVTLNNYKNTTEADIEATNNKIVKTKREAAKLENTIVDDTKELMKQNTAFNKVLNEKYKDFSASAHNRSGDLKAIPPSPDKVVVNDSLAEVYAKVQTFITTKIKQQRSQLKQKEKKIEQHQQTKKEFIAKLITIKEKIAEYEKNSGNISEYEKKATVIKLKHDSINILKKWFSLQTNAFPPYELSTPEDTVFRSLSLQPKEAIATGNNKDTYTVYKRLGTAKEEKAGIWNFKKYELKRLDAIAGLVFVNTDRSSLIYDAATQTFSSKDIGSSDVMLGIKFFPAGIWLEDKRLLGKLPFSGNLRRGTSFINRIAITGGVGVQKSPLRNFFTGFSYDIITGLSFNYGWNFYTKKDYEIKNGAIEKEYESFVRTPYWGITMAPATLLKMLKIINLKP